MQLKIYKIEKVANPITPNGRFTVWEASEMLFLQAILPVESAISSWQSIHLANVVDWPSGRSLSCLCIGVNGDGDSFLISIGTDGKLNLVTHGPINLNSWCYGFIAYPLH